MKRLWGIRHVRWLILTWRFDAWWRGYARHFFLTPNPADLEYLDRVWRGEA